MKRRDFENRLLRRTTEKVMDSTVRRSGTSLRYEERLSDELKPQYVGLAIIVTHIFVEWCCKKVSELKHFKVENTREWPGHC